MNLTLSRERVLLTVPILALCASAWAYLVYLAADMPQMTVGKAAMNMAMPAAHVWELTDFATMFVMWSVMMVAMMLPSAIPMILLYEKINQKRVSQGRARNSIVLFIGGYLWVWIGFSVLATLLNWALHSGGLLTSMMGRLTPLVAGLSLIIAGVYQWTPLKYACLNHCRSPVGFLMTHWHEGQLGAIRMGSHHGLYCFGCCFFLMVLLFVLGVMNLLWIAALTLFVLAEKIVPGGLLLGRISGLLMIAWGGWLIYFVI